MILIFRSDVNGVATEIHDPQHGIQLMTKLLILSFLALIFGQFKPDPKAFHPTAEEFRQMCFKIFQAKNNKERERLKGEMPTSAQIARQPRTTTASDIKSIKQDLAAIDESEKDIDNAPVVYMRLKTAKVRAIGIISQANIETRRYEFVVGNRVMSSQVEHIKSLDPAVATVIKTIDDTTLLCTCEGTEFVWMGYAGDPVVDGEKITVKEIWVASGVYRVDGKSVIAFERWANEDEFWRLRTEITRETEDKE